MLQCCPNGSRPRGAHPALPLPPAELAADTTAVAELGIRSVHVHPRDVAGAESLRAADVGSAVAAIRAAVPQVEIGVTTAAWIEPDPANRVELINELSTMDVPILLHGEEGGAWCCARRCDAAWTPGSASRTS